MFLSKLLPISVTFVLMALTELPISAILSAITNLNLCIGLLFFQEVWLFEVIKLHNELSVTDETYNSGVIITSLMFQRYQTLTGNNVTSGSQLTNADLQ